MPKFKILKSVDAWVNYTTEIEAESAEAALEIAEADYRKWDDKNSPIKWEEDSVTEFDEVQFEIDTVDPVVPE